MIMDPRFRGYSGSVNGIQMRSQPIPAFPTGSVPNFGNQNFVAGPRFENSYVHNSFRDFNFLPPDPRPRKEETDSSLNHEEDSLEDCDFSDAVLGYISQMLMQEDMEEKTCMLQDSLELQAAEKSFYEVLGEKYPPSPQHAPTDVYGNAENSCSNGCSILLENSWMQTLGEDQSQNFSVSTISRPSYSSPSSVVTCVDGLADSPNSSLQVPDWNGEVQSICQFRKGVEEASKFLPGGDNLFVNLDVNDMEPPDPRVGRSDMVVNGEKRDDGEYSPSGLKGRKNFRRENFVAEEERSSKQAAVYSDTTIRSELFDMVLLGASLQGRTEFSALRESLQNGADKIMQQDGQSKVSNSGKGRGKKQTWKKEVVDLRTLLISCAQAVAADDRCSANELLKQIRQHASLFGDGNQRLAYCFADGLEGRLAGTGSQIYKGLASKLTSASDILKAYLLYVAACPFRKVSNFIANKTIKFTVDTSMRLHVIDFGILYGFQWPTLIQRLSMRKGGPPKLRITGIEFPQPGFRPAERVEETGRRLAAYAEEFKVPFEYNAIAKRWDAIKIEELKIDRDELIAVNCLYRGKNLLDESVAANSPRTIVLNLIRQINPHIFIHGVVNGAYNAPFFVTRFREALFHFSSLFDMLETIVPRDYPERTLIEKELLGREALNIVACEGWERTERPETYKQWQGRNQRAGFVQLPFDRIIVKEATDRVSSYYHKDFMIDEDGRWLIQGWKGRILHAISIWRPA
ncbi:hypothetical protein SLE2022_103930 [Rubroshorea leprosula]